MLVFPRLKRVGAYSTAAPPVVGKNFNKSSTDRKVLRCLALCCDTIHRPTFWRLAQGRRRPRRAGGQPRTRGQSVASWPEAPPKFWAVGKSSSCWKFFVDKCKLWSWKTLILGKFMVKIEILSTHGFLCRTFAAVCRNSVGNFQCLSENCKFHIIQFRWTELSKSIL